MEGFEVSHFYTGSILYRIEQLFRPGLGVLPHVCAAKLRVDWLLEVLRKSKCVCLLLVFSTEGALLKCLTIMAPSLKMWSFIIKHRNLARLFFLDFMSIVLGGSVLHKAVVPFQLWVSLVESAKFYEASFYSSSWGIEKTWFLLGVCAREKLINEGVECIVLVAGAVWISAV